MNEGNAGKGSDEIRKLGGEKERKGLVGKEDICVVMESKKMRRGNGG